MSFLDKLAVLLTTVGALNWGSVGLFQFDFVSWALGGSDSILARIVFTLVGIAGVWCISLLFRPAPDEIDDRISDR